MNLLFYRVNIISDLTPDELKIQTSIERFTKFFRMYNRTNIIDRTNSISTPIRTALLFPIPALRPILKTFEEMCNDRAVELLTYAETIGERIVVFWSGGIDSTLVLISLLKNASASQKRNIMVLLSEESICENPQFYREHILGKLTVESSVLFPRLLGGKDIIVSGELNDQLFGSDVVSTLIRFGGADCIHEPYSPVLIHNLFDAILHNEASTDFCMSLFERIKEASPVPIVTNYDFLWWINFSLKWQPVYMRILACATQRGALGINRDYIDTRYKPFYCTEDFQLWSMENMDKKIKDTWSSYKYLCKDIIYDYTKDADYRDNKIKVVSLTNIMKQSCDFNFIDSDFKFYKDIPLSDYYNPDNDFDQIIQES